ncbi:MAG: DUF4301 family protein [Bacteroidota bacterium]|nr:DUF4301 family protein [Bacteroidota bacterium]
MITEKDNIQIANKNIDKEKVLKQIEQFKNGFPFVELYAPATTKNGILSIGKSRIDILAEEYQKQIYNKKVMKFVPASGAASRMFKDLYSFLEECKKTENIEEIFNNGKNDSVKRLITNLKYFAFYEDLKFILKMNNVEIDNPENINDFVKIISAILQPDGLCYSQLPKGLIKFHKYTSHSRTAFEEQLVEGAFYSKNSDNTVNIHFTISPDHKELICKHIDFVKANYEKEFNVIYNISYSIQKSSTDTIAVDINNEPFRDIDGSLIFRPGGHGALIENLNEIKSDIIFIKNIDNVVPDNLKQKTYLFKKALGGLLIEIQNKTFGYLNQLSEKTNVNKIIIKEIISFAKNELLLNIPSEINKLSIEEQSKILLDKLNRPLRICGMVKNQGEPGGGPFWVKGENGNITLQIIESSQIDLNNPKQKEIFNKSTHFNPVDIVCGVRNFKGDYFNLLDFVDESTGFISIKSKNGRDLKAMELPGLWNGAMAGWNTIFVEVPLITFNPVKTINDLLREEHQS